MTAIDSEEWAPLDLKDPFCDHIGGMAMRHTGNADEPIRFGLRVGQQHCNGAGYCHGGLLSTFLDIALGVCAVEVCGDDRGGPTIDLHVTFLSAVAHGDWIESRVTLEHTTRSLIFTRGSVIGCRGPVALGSAIFKRLSRSASLDTRPPIQ